MHRVGYFIQQSWLLIVSSFCFGLLIAVTNAALAPRIKQNKDDKLNNLTKTLLPQARHFQPLDADIEIDLAGGRKEKVKVYKATSDDQQCVGWSFNISGEGFSGKIELVVGVDKDFEKLAGFEVLAHSETPGFGDQIRTRYFRDQFAGAPVEGLTLVKMGDRTKIDSEIVAITGATVSSQAVVNMLNNCTSKVKAQLREKGLISNAKGQ